MTLRNIMEIEELAALDAAGFIAGCGETATAYLERVARIKAAHDDFNARLETEGEAEALEGITVRLADAMPPGIYDLPAGETLRLYGFEVRHVPGFFLSRQVGLLWGGCLISDPDRHFSLFLLRNSFRHREKWLFYSRNELLAHELCHSARQALGETSLEEYFAYQTSPSALRRNFGNCFIRDRDAVLFLLPALLLLAAELVRGFLLPGFPAWIFWPAAAAYPVYLLWRNHQSLKLVRRAAAALRRCGVPEPRPILFRCSREELRELGEMNSREELDHYVSLKAEHEVRWMVIRERFLS